MSSRHTPFFNLLEALGQAGCALCRIGQRAASHYLDAILYESVNDARTQQTLTGAHGLCPTHSRRLLHARDTLGTAILYSAILAHLAGELPPANDGRDWLGRLAARLRHRDDEANLLAPHAPCPACARRDEATARTLSLFVEHHADPELRSALEASAPFCLPHLRQALATLDGPALEMLLERQQAAWDGLRAELRELIRKNDYRFRAEGFGEEGDAWMRAVRATVGEDDVF